MGLFGGPAISLILIGVLVLTLVVLAVAFWQLLRKAGLSPAIGLLALVPVLGLGVVLYAAFAEWPVLAELERLKMVVASSDVPVAGAGTAEAARTA